MTDVMLGGGLALALLQPQLRCKRQFCELGQWFSKELPQQSAVSPSMGWG